MWRETWSTVMTTMSREAIPSSMSRASRRQTRLSPQFASASFRGITPFSSSPKQAIPARPWSNSTIFITDWIVFRPRSLVLNDDFRLAMSDVATRHLLAEPFDDLEQQHSAARFGMWIFLATEVLFFGGLFLAYAVYRYLYPETFAAASHHTEVMLGGGNTAI